jgi:glucosylceramidase
MLSAQRMRTQLVGTALFLGALLAAAGTGCSRLPDTGGNRPPPSDAAGSSDAGPSDAGPIDDGSTNPFGNSVEVYQTSRAAGPGGAPDHLTHETPLTASSMPASGTTTITIHLDQPRQTVLGFGAALTEATASVVSSLPASKQQEILDAYYGADGSGYTLARTHIGSCDFALAQYSYDDSTTPDPTLAKFSIAHDKALLLPLLKRATTATAGTLKILASPWSAPGWMKDNGQMQGHGSDGRLLSQYYATYASYLSKYLQAYQAEGVAIWGITTQNEPVGVGGSREGMEWAPSDMNRFIRDNLAPQLKSDGLQATQIFYFDHNKGDVGTDAVTWAKTILQDPVTNHYVAGTAVHWYGSTIHTYEAALDAINAVDPTKTILFDEGTADALGDTGYGSSSPMFQYSWMKDDFYWKKDGFDWGYWFASRVDHPVYEPAYRYIRDIIVGLNHWYVGFIDWNAVLNRDGGPGHLRNPVPAAILVDPTVNGIYYSPIFYILQHFSKFMRPQARVLATTVQLASNVAATDYDGTPTQDGQALLATAAQNVDGSVVVVLFNETRAPIDYAVVLGTQNVSGTLPAQSLQTLQWK